MERAFEYSSQRMRNHRKELVKSMAEPGVHAHVELFTPEPVNLTCAACPPGTGAVVSVVAVPVFDPPVRVIFVNFVASSRTSDWVTVYRIGFPGSSGLPAAAIRP